MLFDGIAACTKKAQKVDAIFLYMRAKCSSKSFETEEVCENEKCDLLKVLRVVG